MRTATGSRRATRSGDRRLKVLVVDDHAIVREGLRLLLAAEGDMQVCADCGTVRQALELVRQVGPDIAVVDLTLGQESGLELTKTLTSLHPEVRVVVLSMHDEALYARRALAAGALGYVMKRDSATDLVTAIRVVAGGGVYLSPEETQRILSTLPGRPAPASPSAEPIACLSDRERQVFELIGHGLGTREIAERLFVSVKTVETHQSRIREKLGLRHGREVARLAVTWVES